MPVGSVLIGLQASRRDGHGVTAAEFLAPLAIQPGEVEAVRADGAAWASGMVYLTVIAGMTSDDLQPERAQKINETVGRQLRYVNALLRRMRERRFPPNDQMMLAALRAQDGLQWLFMASHYASCKMGVGGSSGGLARLPMPPFPQSGSPAPASQGGSVAKPTTPAGLP